METRTLETPEVDLVYDVEGPLPPRDARPPLVLIGQPMDASGFRALTAQLGDRTVVTYDPRGLGRSVRHDGRTESDPEVQARDLHALVVELGAGPVEVFASSGGAVTGLAWVTASPDDVVTLVAHEPPIFEQVPDAEAVTQAYDRARAAYREHGPNAGMAAFIALTSWPGEITEEFLAEPLPDPATFGMPADDAAEQADASSQDDDPILSDRSLPVVRHRVDLGALEKTPTRVVMAAGEESAAMFPGRVAVAMAERLGQEPAVFPGGHGGFGAEDGPWPGRPVPFAARLREVLDATR